MELNKYLLGQITAQRREKYDGTEGLPIVGVTRTGFIPPKQEEADISIYNQFYLKDFVYNPARMELNSIVYNDKYNKAICSSLYEMFYVTREDLVLPEYLNLIIKSDTFTRHCWFLGSGSAREYCRYANLSEIEIEVPSIQEQEKIVQRYKVVTDRIDILNKINQDLQAAALCIYKNFTSNKENNGKIEDILIENVKSKIQVGESKLIVNGKYPFYTSGENILSWNEYFSDGINCYLNTGGSASVKYFEGKAAYSTDTWSITAKNNLENYLYLLLINIKDVINEKYFFGTGLKHLQKPEFKKIEVFIPETKETEDFNKTVNPLLKQFNLNNKELIKLEKLKSILLPKF